MGTVPIALGIDYDRKQMTLRVKGGDGQQIKAGIDPTDIPKVMAMISHCQQALVLAEVGQKVPLPIDPESVFQARGEYGLSAYEGISRFSVGVDDMSGLVGLTVWSSADRLSSYRVSPDMARKMGEALLKSADQTPRPQRAS